jgi:hypothetical protein
MIEQRNKRSDGGLGLVPCPRRNPNHTEPKKGSRHG